MDRPSVGQIFDTASGFDLHQLPATAEMAAQYGQLYRIELRWWNMYICRCAALDLAVPHTMSGEEMMTSMRLLKKE